VKEVHRHCYGQKEEGMTILDKAKATAERAREQATHGVEMGRARLDEVQARRQHGRLLQKLGEAYYAEHRGEGNREAVVGALGELDAHAEAYPSTAPVRTETARWARDIMHPGAECISESDSLAAAARKMRDLGVGSLPICGADDRLHGIITDRDIVVKCIADGGDPAEVRAGDLAQGTLFWVDATADVNEVLREMEEHQIKRLPVIENHRLVGVISEADLARNLSEHRLAEFVEKVYATR
jgi:CBS domain-containing protein